MLTKELLSQTLPYLHLTDKVYQALQLMNDNQVAHLPIVEGEKTIEQMGEEILEYCIKAASGEVIPKAVLLNQDDFIPWKRGVSL